MNLDEVEQYAQEQGFKTLDRQGLGKVSIILEHPLTGDAHAIYVYYDGTVRMYNGADYPRVLPVKMKTKDVKHMLDSIRIIFDAHIHAFTLTTNGGADRGRITVPFGLVEE